MNCECIYVVKDGSAESYYSFMECIDVMDIDVDLTPTALVRITKDIECNSEYDGCGRKTVIKTGSHVLFAEGKLAHMKEYKFYKNGNRREVLKAVPWFPQTDEKDWWEDIEVY